MKGNKKRTIKPERKKSNKERNKEVKDSKKT
jgi:hypothetical protein